MRSHMIEMGGLCKVVAEFRTACGAVDWTEGSTNETADSDVSA